MTCVWVYSTVVGAIVVLLDAFFRFHYQDVAESLSLIHHSVVKLVLMFLLFIQW